MAERPVSLTANLIWGGCSKVSTSASVVFCKRLRIGMISFLGSNDSEME